MYSAILKYFQDLLQKVFVEIDNKNGELEIVEDNPSLENVSKNVRPVKRYSCN